MFYTNIFAIFLFILTSSNACMNSTIEKRKFKDLKFNKLLSCLQSLGVNTTDVHRRNSGTIYDKLNWQWNTLNGYIQPLAYYLPSDVHDVQNAVICCRSSNVRIVARSGGHSYVKSGFGDARSLIVDLTKINGISIDPIRMTCVVGAGARLGRISYNLWKNGNFIIPGGICPTVGIAGLTLGGGYGRFTTMFGLTSDNVIEMEMVDAKGRLLLINEQTNRDLFWALRGGGGGNFGIVTKFKFKIHPAPRSIVYGGYDYSFDDFSRFYSAWQTLIASGLPKHISADVIIKHNQIKVGIFAMNYHDRNETTSSFANFVNSFRFPIAKNSSIRILSYEELMLRDGQLYSSTPLMDLSQLETLNEYGSVSWKKLKAMFIDKMLNEKQIDQLKDQLGDYLQYSDVVAEPTGGAALSSFSSTDTAFVHRGNNHYHIQLHVTTPPNEPPNLKAVEAMNEFFENSKSIFDHRESYQNYLDQDMVDYLERYYGKNLKRLVQIKRRFDPDNVFHHPQSIPVHFDKLKCKNRNSANSAILV